MQKGKSMNGDGIETVDVLNEFVLNFFIISSLFDIHFCILSTVWVSARTKRTRTEPRLFLHNLFSARPDTPFATLKASARRADVPTRY